MNPLFAISRAVLLRMSRAAALGTLVQRTGWGRRAVQRFVAGDTIEEAVAVLEPRQVAAGPHRLRVQTSHVRAAAAGHHAKHLHHTTDARRIS